MTSFLSKTPTVLSQTPRLVRPAATTVLAQTDSDRDRRLNLNRIRLDSAVELNRANTPASVVDQRKAPRYSIRETNELSNDQIRARLSQINRRQTKPGIIKVLDIIDMPRNVVQGMIADIFLPEAKRAAIERGEFDQSGNAKIFGGDLLRAMGFENRFVNAVAGFGIDILTDPLSFIGGPLGGVKTAGTKGAAFAFTRTGKKQLRKGLGALAKGEDLSRIAPEAANRIRASLAQAPKTLNPRQQAEFVSKEIFGESGRLSKTADRFGLGLRTKGSGIADDLVQVTDDTGRKVLSGANEIIEDPLIANRINASKDFAEKFSTNRGLNLTGGKGGAEIAHIPFTDLTLTVPQFSIGTVRFGNAQATQRAIAKARVGNLAGGATIINASRASTEASEIATKMEQLATLRTQKTEQALSEVNPVARETLEIENLLLDDEITELVGRIEELKVGREGGIVIEGEEIFDSRGRINQLLDNAKDGVGSLEGGDSMGDLLAAATYARNAKANMNLAFAHKRFSDIGQNVARLNSEDIVNGNRFRERLRTELAEALKMDPEAPFDEVLDAARQDEAMLKIIEVHRTRAHDRYKRFLDLSEANVDNASAVADAFQEVSRSAAEVALHAGKAPRDFLGVESRMMTDVAKKILRLDNDEMGDMPFSEIGNMFRRVGITDADQALSNIGFKTQVNFGGGGGLMARVSSSFRRAVSGADDEGGRIAEQWMRGQGRFEGKGFSDLVRKNNVSAKNYDTVNALFMMQVENLGKRRAGIQQLIYKAGDGTFTGNILDKAKAGGVTREQNPGLWRDIDNSIGEYLDVSAEIGVNKARRGDISTAGTGYVTVQLRKEAADKVRLVHRSSGIKNTDTKAFIGALIESTDARGSNMVEFDDANGIAHAFSLDEANIATATASSEADMRALLVNNPTLHAKITEIVDSVEAARSKFGIPVGSGEDTAQALRDLSRPVTPGELNQMASEGKLRLLQGLVGGDLVDAMKIYETDPAVLLQKVVRSDRIAEAKAGFSDAISPFILAKIPNSEKALQIGDNATLATGESIELISPNRYRAGDGRIYRPLDSSAIKTDSLFDPASLMDDATYESLIPEALATQIERMNQVLTPEGLKGVMSLASDITSIFRTSTLLHPSWMVANGMGNALLAVMDDPTLLTNPLRAAQYAKRFTEAMRIEIFKNLNGVGAPGGRVFNRTQKLGLSPERTLNLAGRDQRIADVLRESDAHSLTNGARSGDVQQAMYQTTSRRAPLDPAGTAAPGFTGAFKDRFARNKAVLENRRGTVASGAVVEGIENTRAAAGAAKTNILNKAVRAWFAVNGSVDNTFRLTQYLMKLDDGVDAVSAAQSAQRAMLNFGDLSQFETNAIRPLVPFYSWMRASLPNLLMRSLRDPKQLASTPKLVNAMEELFAGEDRLPRHERPRWIQSQLGVQVGTNPDSISSLGIGTLLPQEGALQVLSGAAGLTGVSDFNGRDFMDSINWLFGQTGPPIKVPTELGFGRESFTNRTIGTKSEGADLSLKEYAFGQVRLAKEFGIGQERAGPVQRAAAAGPGALAARIGVGGRFSQALSEENRLTSFFFELKEREGNLRKTIRRAQKRGDEENVVRFKEELLATYADYLNKGGDPKDVPKWARDDLASFGIGQ